MIGGVKCVRLVFIALTEEHPREQRSLSFETGRFANEVASWTGDRDDAGRDRLDVRGGLGGQRL